MPEAPKPACSTPRPLLVWAGSWLTFSPPSRWRALLTIGLLLGGIGWIDYTAGFWISLQLLYLIPVFFAVAWFGWQAGCITACCSVFLRLAGDAAAGIFEHVDVGTVFWNRLAELVISGIIVFVLHALFSLQRELEDRVRQRTASLEQAMVAHNHLQSQLLEASNRERGAIGHDLHDGLGQHLTAISIATNLLASRLAASHHPSANDAQTVFRLVQEAITQTRQIARGLLLSTIEADQLIPELEELADHARRESGLACQFTLRGTLPPLTVAASSHLFYIAREAILNSLRHANAHSLQIELSVDEQGLTLQVWDDGHGLISTVGSAPGMGLRIMRHRSELIGATFTLDQRAGGGTRVQCRLPLSPGDSAPSR